MRSRVPIANMLPLLQDLDSYQEVRFPATRYQGSKLKLVDWIWNHVADLRFDTVLDAFGGTGCVSHMFKLKEKQVTYNDILSFNHIIGLALIENDSIRLSQDEVRFILTRHSEIKYQTFIQDTFEGIYYNDEENQWLDSVATNIRQLERKFSQAIAYFALFQACIVKRPFNLFHRKNLYIRTSDVERNFGNKASWDRSFESWFRQFVNDANAAVCSNGKQNVSLNCDAMKVGGEFDLVYIDTPYISERGVGVDYHHFYHFLEGLADYPNWPGRTDYRKKHRPLLPQASPWTDKNEIHGAFDKLFNRFSKSILVISYRANGIPSDQELLNLLRKYKKDVVEVKRTNYKYVLSINDCAELLFIAR